MSANRNEQLDVEITGRAQMAARIRSEISMIQFNSNRSLASTANLPVLSGPAAQGAARRTLVTSLAAALLTEVRTRSADGASATGRLGILAMVAVPDIDRRTITLDEIASDPDLVRLISPEVAAQLTLRCSAVLAALATVGRGHNVGDGAIPPQRDKLLKVDEAAERLACSKDWLYRHANDLPFTVRQGGMLRFSSKEIDQYIRRRQNK
jgi:excisionase family DNA binding protein